jgi:hypothetical protein
MRSVILVATISIGCGSSGTSGDDTIDDGSTDAPSNDGGGDARPDGPAVSYAPCDACCDPIAQDCGANQGCHPNDNGMVTTCKAEGTMPLGGGCGVDTDCIAGTTCLGDDFGNFFRCYKLCLVDAECSAFPSTQNKCTLYTVPAGREPYGICFP